MVTPRVRAWPRLVAVAVAGTVPVTTFMVTVSSEFVASLPSGRQEFEVLAIDASANQTITEGSFVKP
jgi:hypothetical protein